MHCVVHYSDANRTYSTLKTLSENQLSRLNEAKSVREKETLEANRHSVQCVTIPTKEDFNCSVHGIHLSPCYKSFTNILCPSRKRTLLDTSTQVLQRTKRQKRSSSTADLLPATCFKCNGSRLQKRGKSEYPHKAILQSAALKLKLAAIKSNDETRIIQFNARDQSTEGLQYLMEKEIMTHNECYTDYVRCLKEKSTDRNLSSCTNVTGDFAAVKESTIIFCTVTTLFQW